MIVRHVVVTAVSIMLATVTVDACSTFTSDTTTAGGEGGPGDAQSDESAVTDAAVPEAGATCTKPTENACPSGGLATSADFGDTITPTPFVRTPNAGGIVERSAEGSCGPGALHASATVGDGGGVSALIEIDESGAPTHVRNAYSFRTPNIGANKVYFHFGCTLALKKDPAAESRTLIGVRMVDTRFELFASTKPDGGAVTEIGTAQLAIADQRFANRWHSIDIGVTIGDAGGTATVEATFDGMPFALTPAVPVLEPTGAVRLYCGIYDADSVVATYDVDIDDLRFEMCQ